MELSKIILNSPTYVNYIRGCFRHQTKKEGFYYEKIGVNIFIYSFQLENINFSLSSNINRVYQEWRENMRENTKYPIAVQCNLSHFLFPEFLLSLECITTTRLKLNFHHSQEKKRSKDEVKTDSLKILQRSFDSNLIFIVTPDTF